MAGNKSVMVKINELEERRDGLNDRIAALKIKSQKMITMKPLVNDGEPVSRRLRIYANHIILLCTISLEDAVADGYDLEHQKDKIYIEAMKMVHGDNVFDFIDL